MFYKNGSRDQGKPLLYDVSRPVNPLKRDSFLGVGFNRWFYLLS